MDAPVSVWLAAAVVVSVVASGCGGGGEARERRNAEVVRRYLEEVLNTGRVEGIADFVAEDYVEVYQGQTYPLGLVGAIAHVEGVRAAFPDLHVTVERQISEGDWVATQITVRGTHRGPFLGMAPSGEALVFTGVNLDRVVDGRIVEHGGAANLLEPLLGAGSVRVAEPAVADEVR